MNLKFKIVFLISIFSLCFSSIYPAIHCEQEKIDFLELMNNELPKVIDSCDNLNGQFCCVQILKDGGPSFINSVYLISLKNNEELIIKIGNPIWEKDKTLNEVFALKFLKENTTIPVPDVLAYECDKEKSPIKNEYIIMPRLLGQPLNKEINRIYEDKLLYHKILNQLASYIIELKKFQFPVLGNFTACKGNSLEVGGIVDFANYEVKNSCQSYSEYAWHAMNFYLKEMEILYQQKSQDSDLYKKYIPILKDLLSEGNFNFLNGQDHFVFSHQDFVMKNILVHEDNITAVLDWEWSGSALMENESMTGFDFLLTEEDKIYFAKVLENFGLSHFFDPPPPERQLFYRLLGNIYTLVAFREWKEGKLEHTAKFLSQKLEQRKIRNDPNFDIEAFKSSLIQDLDACIIEFRAYLRGSQISMQIY